MAGHGTMDGTVSFVIPTLNEQRNILRCLDSIGKQTYPHELIEIVIADAHSSDRTVEIIEEWQQTHDIRLDVVPNDKVVAEFGKTAALRKTSGAFVCVMDCDEEIVQDDAVACYVKAFDIYPDIVGVEQCFLKIPGGYALNNFFALTRLTDALAHDITIKPTLIDTRQLEGKTYRKYEFSPAYPALLFMKRDYVEQFLEQDTYEEGQVMLDLALQGANKMCIIEGYGVRHHHIQSFSQFLRKRAKIALKHTTRVKERKTWVNYTGRRLYVFAFLHLTLVYPLVYSVIRAVREREPVWLFNAPICFLTTASYIANWLWIKVTGKKAW